jgi:hypothetical protein
VAEESTPDRSRTCNLRLRRRKSAHQGVQESQGILSGPPAGSSTGSSNSADPGIQLTTDLARIVENWPTLPDHIKAAVMALVATAPNRPPAGPTGLDDTLPPGFERTKGESG